jgi:hypothetical protein
MVQAFDAVAESVAHAAAATCSSVLGKKRLCAQSATFTRPMSTGTSTSGPMTAANAAPLWMPKLAMATAMASSKLLEAAVNESVGRLLVVGAHALAHEERDREHHHEVDEQRHRDAEDVER